MSPAVPFSLHTSGDVRIALAINLVLGLAAWKSGYLKRGGLVAALLVGTPLYIAFGWPGFVLWVAGVAAVDVATKHAVNVTLKRSQGVSDRKIGAKSFGAVFLPGVWPLVASVVFVVSANADSQFLALMAFLAAFGTYFGDLLSTEFGQVYGKRTFSMISLERVRPGTRGGVSVEGSLYGIVAMVLFAVAAYGLFRFGGLDIRLHQFGLKEALIVVLAAVLANHIESAIAGVMGQFQRRPDKRLLSFLGCVIGALLALFFTNLPEG